MEHSIEGLTVLESWILVIWGISLSVGLWRGVTREILNILGWACAALGTLWVFPWISPWGRSVINPPLVADSLSVGIVFIVILSVCTVTNHSLSEWVKESRLNNLDRFLGGIFGVARGIFGVGLAYSAAMAWLPQPTRNWISGQSGPVLEVVIRSSQWLSKSVPALGDMGSETSTRVATLTHSFKKQAHVAIETLPAEKDPSKAETEHAQERSPRGKEGGV